MEPEIAGDIVTFAAKDFNIITRLLQHASGLNDSAVAGFRQNPGSPFRSLPLVTNPGFKGNLLIPIENPTPRKTHRSAGVDANECICDAVANLNERIDDGGRAMEWKAKLAKEFTFVQQLEVASGLSRTS